MATASYKDRIVERLDDLTADQLRRVWEFVETVEKRPKGEPGWKIIQDARELGFSKEDLDEMERAIEEACEIIEDEPNVNFDE